jgi:hypothetical protein
LPSVGAEQVREIGVVVVEGAARDGEPVLGDSGRRVGCERRRCPPSADCQLAKLIVAPAGDQTGSIDRAGAVAVRAHLSDDA